MTDEKPRKLTLKRTSDAADGSETPRLLERLHKVLAQAGLGSRRALEQRIGDGLVKVNGEVAQVGMSIGSGDKVEIDGRSFVASALTEPARVLMYNKPESEVTTREDPEGRPTIFEALPAIKGARWIAIGRLDINTTGLLLLTTDGELANALMHPSNEVEREYVCRVRAPEGEDKVPDNLVDRLARGVALDDGAARFDEIERIGGSGVHDRGGHDWFRVLLKEGRNREVRRLWESQGCQVSRLKRIRYGVVELPRELLRGQSQEMASDKVEKLRTQMGLEDGAPSALTLQSVIGQRKAARSTINFAGEGRAHIGGPSRVDEGRELRRFDNVREDRGGRFGNKRPHGGLTVSGDAAAKQAHKPYKQRQDKGPRALPEGNPAAFRTWFVPEGVDTGPSGHRNADGQPPRKPYGKKPGGARPGGPRGSGGPGTGGGGGYQGERAPRGAGGPGGPGRSGGPGGSGGPRGPGASPYGERNAGGHAGERRPGGGQGAVQSQRSPRPYGHPGNAPSFPSDHANPGSFNPYGDKPRSPAPRGPRPGGKPAGGQRPGGPGGPRPGGPAGPRPGGPRPGGPRGGRPGGGDTGSGNR